MKKNVLFRSALLAVALMCGGQSHAQLKNLLKNVASSAASAAASSAAESLGGSVDSTTVQSLISLVQTTLGTSEVSAASIVGTWSYSKPCIALQSDNVLTKLGAKAAMSSIENKFSSALEKIKFTSGIVKVTFKEDGTGTITYGKSAKSIKWSISGTDLTLEYSTTLAKSITVNAKQSDEGLQLAMADTKIISFLEAATGKASTSTSALSTVNAALKTINGVYIGLIFQKEE